MSGELDQRLDVGGGDLGMGFVEPADPHPDRLDPLDQQIVGTSRRRRAAEKPEDQDAPAPSEAAQRLFKCRAVDRVVNDVDAAAAGQLHDLVAEAGLIVDRVIRALFEADRAFLLGAGASDDIGTVELGDLDSGKADAAGGAMDQDPLACLEPAALQQRMKGRVIDVAENCRVLQAHRGGDQVAILGLRITQLRETAEPMSAHHSIAGFEAGHAGPDGDNLTPAFAARDEGRLWPELVFAGQHEHVDILDPARLDSNLQLSLPGRRRVGHLTQCQYLRPAERLADDSPHRRYSAACACTSAAAPCERSFSITSQFV